MGGDVLDEVDEQGDEIARLRRENESLKEALRRLADQNATFSVIGGNIIVDVEPVLTDEERDAIVSAVLDYEQNDDDEDCAKMVSTLRGLLERTAV